MSIDCVSGMKTTETEGGWMWWVSRYKEAHPDTIIDYKSLLQQYMAGVKWEDADVALQ